MEYYTVARALKSSLRRELPMMMKSSLVTQQSLLDDMFVNNSNSPLVEDFSVDCFFDFSNGGDIKDNSNNNICNIQEPQVHMINVHDDDDDDDDEEKDSVSVSSQEKVHDSFLTVEPIDELAELEWVSRFVDDSSSSELSLLYPIKSQDHHARKKFQPEQPGPVALTRPSCLFSVKIPAKSRSKRRRPTGRTWSIDSLPTETSPSSSSHSSSSSSSSSTITSASTACLATVHTNFEPSLSEPPMKKPKKNQTADQTGGAKGLIQFQRKCSHCQVQKTPQWRTGPLGAKTLCNACGVRYKSGRLFPEYRPACSPTFSSDVHSNSHRKVLEMRKRKEIAGPASGLSHMVQSF